MERQNNHKAASWKFEIKINSVTTQNVKQYSKIVVASNGILWLLGEETNCGNFVYTCTIGQGVQILLLLLLQVDMENSIKDAAVTKLKQDVEELKQEIETNKEAARTAGFEHKLEELKKELDAQQVNCLISIACKIDNFFRENNWWLTSMILLP